MNALDFTTAKLLVVEDDPDYLQRLQNRLEKYGYQSIDKAITVEEARLKLDESHYDIIISDMRLGKDTAGGFTVVEEVKRRKINSIVIILTANETVSDCRRALKWGTCWDYISKTMEDKSALDELHQSIQEALAYLNRFGNREDELWIEENRAVLLEKYSNKYIAVLNNKVLVDADTEEELKLHIEQLKFPIFLPVIQKMETQLYYHTPLQDLWLFDESPTLEFKSTLQWNVKAEKIDDNLRFACLKTITAFLNAQGGTLLIGIYEPPGGQKTVFGLENDYAHLKGNNRDGFENQLRSLIKNYLGAYFNSSELITLRFEKLEDKDVCAVDVKKSPQLAFLRFSAKSGEKERKAFFLRTGNRTDELDAEQFYKYIQNRL